MSLRNVAKRVIPKKVKVMVKLSKVFWYDFARFTRNSNIYQRFDTENKLKGKLNIFYHVVEKGLTMPDTRLGFGSGVVMELISMVNMYINKGYNLKSLEFVHSVNVLKEYVEFHHHRDFRLDSDIVKKIDEIVNRIDGYTTSKQLEFDRDVYFAYSESSFDKFSLSRYSCRNYTAEEIPLEIVQKCIRLALKSPTSCNRQVNRIYVVRDPAVKEKVLKLQYGNRGFGHLASTVFVVTADISVFQGPSDRNESYINTGMFAMSLMYALHRYRIGACPLNWSVYPEKDLQLRKVLGIPGHERVGLVISAGYLPDKVRIASSPRLDISEVIKIFDAKPVITAPETAVVQDRSTDYVTTPISNS